MVRIQEPTIRLRAGRFLGTHFRGVKGLYRLLRLMHNPDKRQDTWMETDVRAIPDGPNFHVSTRWFGEWTTWFYGTPDPHIDRWLRENAKPDWIAFDIGMNFGYFACVMARICAQAHGFEPVPWVADRAEANSKLNHFTNLVINRIALSNQCGETELFILPEASNDVESSLLRGSGRSPLRVSMDTVDRYVSDKKLNRLDFLKIDVEGAEHLVLEGAVESLNRLHPTVIFEMNSESFARCEQLLRSAEYELYDLNGTRLAPNFAEGSHDVLAMHPSRS